MTLGIIRKTRSANSGMTFVEAMAMQSSNLSGVHTRPRQANAGVTLIELSIALFVIALVFAGVFGMSSQVTKVVSQARGETRAIEAAQFEIERLRAMTWDAISTLGSSYTMTDADNTALASVPHGVGTVTIAPYPATNTLSSICSVTVTIQWGDAVGDAQTSSISTLIAQHGLNP